jgi:hypothetical protein
MKSQMKSPFRVLLFAVFLLVSMVALRVWAQPDYAPAHYAPMSCSKWYTSGNGHKFAVIHDMEGYYESTISYLNRCDLNTNGDYNVAVSIHYMVNGLKNGSDEDGHSENNSGDVDSGDITQSVRESRYAWHARCLNTWSFGTEHEGFVSSPVWYTEAMYQASAGLQRHLCDVWSIPKDRNHIVGHNEWQNAAWRTYMSNNFPSIDVTCNTHTDPGQYWNWNHFMDLVIGAPSIATQPWSRVADRGSNTVFNVSVSGAAPLVYQWRKNGTNILGATTNSYSIASVQPSDAANYIVVITNSAGSTTSRVAVLTVNPVWLQGFSDDFNVNTAPNWNVFWGAGNGILDFTTNWAFNFSNATYVANGVTNPIPASPNSGGSKLGLKIAVNKNDATAATAGVSLYPKNVSLSNNYSLRFDAWINYNGVSGGGSGSTEYMLCGLNHAGLRVNWTTNNASFSDGLWFAVDGEGGSGGSDYRAMIGNGIGAPTVMGFATNGLSANGAASDNVSDPFYQALFPAPTYESGGAPGKKWVQVELSQLGNVITWQINGIVVAQRTNTSAYTNGNVMIGYMDPFTSIANPAADNFMIVDNARVLIGAITPSITTQPTNKIVAQGSNATFAVAATGFPSPAYQWRRNNVNIAGATSSGYTRMNCQPADVGVYSALITNISGSVSSTSVTLGVNSPPAITTQPQDQNVKIGTNAIFTVVATGTPPLSYQWRFKGVNIVGAIGTSYTRLNVTTNDTGNYSVLVSNVVTTAVSSNAFLTVIAPSQLQFGDITLLSENQIKLVINGDAGGTVTLWRSDNLSTWELITNLPNPTGAIEFVETISSEIPQRFYRAQVSP